MGFNTGSPCFAWGRVYYATTAGNLHILDAESGHVLKSVPIGAPVISSVTYANDSIYLHAVDAVVRCFDRDGNLRWAWDHYARYVEDPERAKAEAPKRGHPGSYERPHFGGREVSVSGRRVVISAGWDLFCLEDQGTNAAVVWRNRAPAGRDGMIPMCSSISSGFVYTAGMGADGVLGLMKTALEDGRILGVINGGAFPWITPAARGSLVIGRGFDWLKDEILAIDFEKRRERLWQDKESASPVVCSHALTRSHVVAGLLNGELLVIDLVPGQKREPFRFKIPSGKPIGSSPAVSRGRVYLGCDDGHLYVLGPGSRNESGRPLFDSLRSDNDDLLISPRSRLGSATGRIYGWPSACGNDANNYFVNDPQFQPPLRLRWAARGYGHFKTPIVISTSGDLVTITLIHGIVTCQEQMTGRLRWRVRCPPAGWGWSNSSGLLIAEGRLYVPRPNDRKAGQFFCLDLKEGRCLWAQPIGVVAFGNVVRL
ncbi:MAG: outer membrane protein assembly factor BamB family protein [Kiritimatiellia bacterium]